jgi:hypothetical protein
LGKATLLLLKELNMTRPILFIFLISFLPFSNTLFSQGKIKNLTSDISKIPKEAKCNGALKEFMRWTDVSGEYLVIISESKESKKINAEADMEERNKQLFAVCYQIKKDSLVQKWKVFDQISKCPFDLTISFIQNVFQVTDLNNDGLGEVWMVYKMVCRSDVSPCDMKIIMYEGQQKFAMRGQNKVKMSETEYFGGDYKFDKAFNDGPREFRDFALKLWEKNIIENWEK